MRLKLSAVICSLFLFALGSHAGELTMQQLRAQPNLTPLQFARYFANFEYKFHPEIQPHNKFLATRSGDCDDYATVAADALARHGWTPRMITVRMPGATHVVCYIEELHAYLDYNMRAAKNPLVACDPEISAIANSVARSFGLPWSATYEFTYDEHEDVKRLVDRIIPNPGYVIASAAHASEPAAGAKK